MEEIGNIWCYLITGKRLFHNIIFYEGYYQHLCYHLYQFTKEYVIDVQMGDIFNSMVRFFTILINNITMKIVDIYVSITTSGYLISQININQWKRNSPNVVLAHPDLPESLIDTHTNE